MNIETLSHCIICLDNETSDQKLYPIPCNCKAFIHKECFQKLEEDECIICHSKNKYSEVNKDLKNIRNIKTVSNTFIEIQIEENEYHRNTCINYCNNLQNKFYTIINKFTIDKNILDRIFPYFTIIITMISWLIATYLIGLFTRIVLLIFMVKWDDNNVFSHILITTAIGMLVECVILACCINSDQYD